MENKPKDTIKIDGITYVQVDQLAPDLDGVPYSIVRSYSAGVFAGYLTERSADGRRGKVLQARRLWYWDGANSLSDAAINGFACPENCKFPPEVSEIELTEIIEVLPCNNKAFESIKKMPVWTQH